MLVFLGLNFNFLTLLLVLYGLISCYKQSALLLSYSHLTVWSRHVCH